MKLCTIATTNMMYRVYCFTVCAPTASFVSSFNDGTHAVSTDIAMDAAMNGPIPTWKSEMPFGIVANELVAVYQSVAGDSVSRVKAATPFETAASVTALVMGIIEDMKSENGFPATPDPVGIRNARIGISVQRRTHRMYRMKFTSLVPTSFLAAAASSWYVRLEADREF